MQPTVNDARPPYVSFLTRAVEDRNASIEKGAVVMVDVDYAIVTPHGSKDRLEKVVKEWFATLDEAVKQERMPQVWVDAYKGAYKAYKEGREVPVTGTSVRNWPLLTPAQVENLISMRVLTVEDLAAANEELLTRLGMGARALKDKATTWLQTAGSPGAKLAERMTDFELQNERLTATNAELVAANTRLQAQVEALQPKAAAPAKA